MTYRRPAIIANEIRLKRSQHSGPFLVVEGQDDRLFMERFTCRATCKIEVAQGKQNVCEVIRILDNDNFPGILGLIDSDFDRIEGVQYKSPNLLMPEFHDLEMMLICSAALDRVLVEFGSQCKISKFGADILRALLNRALPLGHLLLYSQRNRLDLKFDGLRFSAWIDRTSFVSCTTKLVDEVKNHSQRHDLLTNSLETEITNLDYAKCDPREVCRGSDLVEILSIGLRGKLGNRSRSEVNGDALRRSLRLAYAEKEFEMSSLAKDIHHWEALSRGYKVLKNL